MSESVLHADPLIPSFPSMCFSFTSEATFAELLVVLECFRLRRYVLLLIVPIFYLPSTPVYREGT